MADPAFRTLLFDYMREISDPAARAEQEAYLASLEADSKSESHDDTLLPGETAAKPSGTLIHPREGFALEARTKTGEVVYVNVCEHELVEQAKFQRGDSRGVSVALPHLVSPPRMVRDAADHPTMCFDACVHPDTLHLARRDARMRGLLVDAAIETVARRMNDMARGSKDAIVFEKDVKQLGEACVGGKPAVMHVPRSDSAGSAAATAPAAAPATVAPKSTAAQPPAPTKAEPTPTPRTAAPAPAPTPADAAKHRTVVKAGANRPSVGASVPSPVEAVSTRAGSTQPQRSLQFTADGTVVLEPALQTSYRTAAGELSASFNAVTRADGGVSVASTRPAELVLSVHVPLVASASQLDCDLHERRFQLTTSSIKAPLQQIIAEATELGYDVGELRRQAATAATLAVVYKLDASLPYPVLYDAPKVSSKFRAKDKTLVLSAPVQPAPVVMLSSSADAPVPAAAAPEAVAAAQATQEPTDAPRAEGISTHPERKPASASEVTMTAAASVAPAAMSPPQPEPAPSTGATQAVRTVEAGTPAYRFSLAKDAVSILVDVPHVLADSVEASLAGVGVHVHRIRQRKPGEVVGDLPLTGDVMRTIGKELVVSFVAACSPQAAAEAHRSVASGFGFPLCPRTDAGPEAAVYRFTLRITLYAPMLAGAAVWDTSTDNLLVLLRMPPGMSEWPSLLSVDGASSAPAAAVSLPGATTAAATPLTKTTDAVPAPVRVSASTVSAPSTASVSASADARTAKPAAEASKPASTKAQSVSMPASPDVHAGPPARSMPAQSSAVASTDSAADDDIIEMDSRGVFDLTREKPRPAAAKRASEASQPTRAQAAASNARPPMSTSAASSSASGANVPGGSPKPRTPVAEHVKAAIRQTALDID